MIEIDDKIVSADLLRECFACDLAQCKGICCVEGNAGAPLEAEEVEILSPSILMFSASARRITLPLRGSMRQFSIFTPSVWLITMPDLAPSMVVLVMFLD